MEKEITLEYLLTFTNVQVAIDTALGAIRNMESDNYIPNKFLYLKYNYLSTLTFKNMFYFAITMTLLFIIYIIYNTHYNKMDTKPEKMFILLCILSIIWLITLYLRILFN